MRFFKQHPSAIIAFTALLTGIFLINNPIEAKAKEALVVSSDMTLTNASLALYDGGVVINEGKTLTITGDLDYGCPININSGTLVVTGNMIASNLVSLNEYATLTVYGNYTQKSERYRPSPRARATIDGNFNVITSGSIATETSSIHVGQYSVTNIKGDFNYSSRANSSYRAGEFKISGNFKHEPDSGSLEIWSVVFQGNNQKLLMQSNTKFSNFTPGKGTLYLDTLFNIQNLKGDLNPSFEGDTLYMNHSFTVSNCTFTVNGNLVAGDGFIIGDEGVIIIAKNLISTGGVEPGKTSKLKIGQNYTQKKYAYNPYPGARIEIGGDFNVTDSGYMATTSGSVHIGVYSITTVKGNLNYDSLRNASLGAGELNVAGNVNYQTESSGMKIWSLVMPNQGSKVIVSSGTIENLTLYHDKDKYTVSDNCVSNLRVVCDITFNANGGKMENKTITVKTGNKIGTLPTPTRTGYEFIGWYTNNIAGDLIGQNTDSPFLKDTTLWAHWKAQENAQIREFVNRLYLILLDREADPSGLDDWTNRLANGSANAAQIVEGIVNSKEFEDRNLSYSDVVEKMYQAMLGRSSDQGGKANWINKLDGGLSANSIINGFSGSEEFGKICSDYNISAGNINLTEPRDQNSGIAAFVARCYQKALGRNYEKGGMNNWCSEILNAPDKKKRAEEVASDGFFHSQEFLDKHTSNDEYVEILYRTFLGREFDSAGKADWVGKLNSGVSRDEVLYGFSRSIEFANIMAQYGL